MTNPVLTVDLVKNPLIHEEIATEIESALIQVDDLKGSNAILELLIDTLNKQPDPELLAHALTLILKIQTDMQAQIEDHLQTLEIKLKAWGVSDEKSL